MKLYYNPFIEKRLDFALLILRISFGGSMLFAHGWSKLEKLLWGIPSGFPDPLGIGDHLSLALTVFAEVLCSFFVVAGFKIRLSVLPLIITMLVVILIVHSGDPFIKNEKAVMYLTAYFVFLLCGAGKYSLDFVFSGTKNITNKNWSFTNIYQDYF